MKMRSLLMGLMVAASAQVTAGVTQADQVMVVDIKLPVKKAGTNSTVPANTIAEIKVDGSLQKGPYDSVRNETLEYVIAARGDRHKSFVGDPLFWLKVDGGGSGGGDDLGKDWKYFAVTRDYIDPRATGIENQRVSPVDLCNAKLKAAAGSARAAFLKKGVTFLHKDAYDVTGTVWVEYGRALKTAEKSETIRVPVKITCMALDRPRPRQDSSTKGPPPRPGKPMAPTISEVSLRVEPAQIMQDGKFLCPTKLKLYGTVDVIRKFYGQAVFVGPHYLSNITTLNYPDKGHRNVTGTYPMNWDKAGGITIGASSAPVKQKLTFRFNVADKDGKVLESAKKTIEVSCRKVQANSPTAGDGMTVKPAN